MSHTPTSPSSSFRTPQRTYTPESIPPTIPSSGSCTVAPKSEYLRSALQARREQTTSTPSPQHVQPMPPPALRPTESKTPKIPPDGLEESADDFQEFTDDFEKFALSEEHTTPVSPIRPRRPSNVGPPPTKTSRELTTEMKRLKDSLMTTNMRVELLNKDNKKLQHNLTEAKEQIERLQPYEDEAYELRAENQQLRIKMEDMDEEMATLKETNADHLKTNEELTAIASESAAHWSAHESAIDEAAECIIKMEEEKHLLSKELQQLKERIMVIESNSSCGGSTLVNSSDKHPSPMYSIESRPSTSHFDSDYYSQPASPRKKQSSESMDVFSPSERSKKFLDLNAAHRRSARELVHRLSVASLRSLGNASPSPAPESPCVSTMYHQQQISTIMEDDASDAPRDTRRHHGEYQALPSSLLGAAEISPPRPHTVAPQAPAPQPGGLRGLYRSGRSSTSRTSNALRSSSSQISSPTNPATLADRPHSTIEISRSVSSGGSGNHRNSGIFGDRLHHRSPRHRQSGMNLRSGHYAQPMAPAPVSLKWDKQPPIHSPPVSLESKVDLTGEGDPRQDTERWWRSMDRLTLNPVYTLSQPHLNATQPSNNNPVDQDGQSSQLNVINAQSQPLRSHTIPKPKPAPAPALGDTPHSGFGERFLFNSNESEEGFMRKVRSLGSSRRRALNVAVHH